MIIKSTARKTPSFGQLLNYIHKSEVDRRYRVCSNLYGDEEKYVKNRFFANSQFVKKRKNGNFLYHDIVSFTKAKKISLQDQKEKIQEIMRQYIEARAKRNICYGVMHDGKNNDIHYHIIISANELNGNKKLRLTQRQFDGFKKRFEDYVLEKYPELEQKRTINKKATKKISRKGAELKRRTGKMPQRDRVKNELKEIFSTAGNKMEFFNRLADHKLEIYALKTIVGFRDLETGRKFRVRTLGLEKEFYLMSDRIELAHIQDDVKKKNEEILKNQDMYRQAKGSKEFVSTGKSSDKNPRYDKIRRKEPKKPQPRKNPGVADKKKSPQLSKQEKAKQELKQFRQKMAFGKKKTKTK